jgi:uncharacterized membrane protein
MSSKLTRTLFAAAVAAGLALSTTAIPTSLALAASPGGKSQTKGESTKKPGEDCENFKHGSKEYKSCVTQQAQSDKTDTKGKGAKGKDSKVKDSKVKGAKKQSTE